MKRLMIAAAIVCAAVGAQAYSVDWGSGDLYAGAKGDEIGSGTETLMSGTGYLFLLNGDNAATDWATLTTAEAIFSAFNGSDTLTVNGHDYGVTSAVDVDYGYIGWDATSVNNGDLVYAASIITTGEGDAMLYAANAFSAKGGTSGIEGADPSALSINWVNMGVTGDATVWSAAAVPEPTSGLLLLLGVAGLALRRRRA